MEEIVDSIVWSVSEWVSKREEFEGSLWKIFIDLGQQLLMGYNLLKIGFKLLGCLLLWGSLSLILMDVLFSQIKEVLEVLLGIVVVLR